MLNKAEKAVLATVTYSAQFDHPLHFSEIYERLLTNQGLRTVDASFSLSKTLWQSTPLARKEQLAKTLRSLVKKKILIHSHQYYALFGREQSFARRWQAGVDQRQKKPVILELVSVVRRIPWIEAVAITGSHAAGGATEKDDIDFLVVTQRNRMWLARLLMLFYAWKMGHRLPLPDGDMSHSWDLNFWLDETRLALPPPKQTVYEAYEILQMRWVFNRYHARQRFLLVNPWVGKLLVSWSMPKNQRLSYQFKKFDLLAVGNWLAFMIEIGYRTLRHGRQRADLHSAFFHPSNTRQHLFSAWKSLYWRSLGKKIVLVTGVFDVLHQEHQNFLKAAKKVGDVLIVGLESDQRVRTIKGPARPVNNQLTRLANVKQWRLADEGFVLPENFGDSVVREQLIGQFRPHILAVSSHSPHLAEKRRVLKKFGGMVKVVYQHRKGVSSTRLIKQKIEGDTLSVS